MYLILASTDYDQTKGMGTHRAIFPFDWLIIDVIMDMLQFKSFES